MKMTEEESKEFQEFLKWKADQKKKEVKEEVQENKTESSNQVVSPEKVGGGGKVVLLFSFLFVVFIVIFACIVSMVSHDIPRTNNVEKEPPVRATAEQRKANALVIAKKDSIKRAQKATLFKELSKDFYKKKDDYSDSYWMLPNNYPKFINVNKVCCYIDFNSNDNTPNSLHFKLCYTSEDWLFIRNVKFNCDGKVFTYIPDEVNRDNDSSIWEWFDERVTAENEPLFQAIANASKVKMKINGDQYYDERVLSNKERYYIKQAYKYYKALGGTFI